MNNNIKEITNLEMALGQSDAVVKYHDPNRGNFCGTFQNSKNCMFEVLTKNNQKYWISQAYYYKNILGLPIISYDVITVYDGTNNVISQAEKWKKGYKKLRNLFNATENLYQKQEASKNPVR
ncbi:MAG: hypothetical protein IKO56_11095 [Alphaproteobacteria bacterium]|nr:hypothetical protein [Alphaproteobacteria bacterium]